MNRKIKLTQDLIDIRAFAEANNENTRKRFNSPQTKPNLEFMTPKARVCNSLRNRHKTADTYTSDVGSGNAPAGCRISRTSSEGSSELWDFLGIEGGKG